MTEPAPAPTGRRWRLYESPRGRSTTSRGGRAMIRLAHFSDIHVTAAPLGWRPRDWFNKRLPGWINYRWLGRSRRFRAADEVVEALVADLRERRPDRTVFSGDATALGFEAEFARAAELLRLDDP